MVSTPVAVMFRLAVLHTSIDFATTLVLIIGWLGFDTIITSSLPVGTVPSDQLLAVAQAVLVAPVQVLVAAFVLRARLKNTMRVNAQTWALTFEIKAIKVDFSLI